MTDQRRGQMRIVGIRRDGGDVEVATRSDDGAQVTVVAGLEEFWADAAGFLSREPAGETVPAADVEFVPPVLPGARVICIGLNYLKHVAEGSYASEGVPPYPTLFARWTQSLTVDGAEVPIPSNEDGLDWEGEVMAWVGSTLVDATPDEALAAVVGYSSFNDLTSRRAQKLTSQWILGKNGDQSGPLGPMVGAAEVGDLRDGLRVQTRVNGETVQDGHTDEMVYTVGDTLSLISHTFTLRPGDLLATGTPSGVGYGRTPPWLLQPGDVVEVEVERIGDAAQHRRRQRRPAEGLTMSGEFRQYLFPHDHPRLAEVRGMDPYAYREFARKPGTFTGGLVEGWTPLYQNEFRGVTEDGTLREGLYPFEPARAGEEAPVEAMVAAADDLLAALDDDGRKRICLRRRRRRVADLGQPRVHAVRHRPAAGPAAGRGAGAGAGPGARLALPRGLRAGARDDADQRLPRRGGRPRDRPQRVQLQRRPLRRARPARPLGLAALRPPLRGQLPRRRGPDGRSPRCSSAPSPTRSTPARTPGSPTSFAERIELGTALMAALPAGPAPRGHRLRADGRPGDAARPRAPRRRAAPRRRVPGQPGHPVRGRPRRRHARRGAAGSRWRSPRSSSACCPRARAPPGCGRSSAHLDETWFSWIGGHAARRRLLLPAAVPRASIAELDHHCGVFLDYDTPQPFHVHTVLRTPHGNDYGRSWVRQWQERNDDR